jgi:hypothetical protein
MTLSATIPTLQRLSLFPFKRCATIDQFNRFSSSVSMSAVYNYAPNPRNDPLVQILQNALDLGLAIMTPEKAIILKTFPFCEPTLFDK